MQDERKEDELPEIYIAQRVIDKMCTGALRYAVEETGEAMIGLELPNGNHRLPKIYILETIPPIEDTVREWAMFEQGDDWQGAIINWWHDNWEMYRDMRRSSYGNAVISKWDAPLIHLGDWHKQPGLIKPSRGDWNTARRFMKDFKRDHLITPIVTLVTEITEAEQANTLIIKSATDVPAIRIDFWWIAKRGADFEKLKPVVMPNEDLPRLPPVAWWLEQRERFDSEINALERDGLQVLDVITWDSKGHPPLDTCLTIYRSGSRNVFIAITSVHYPLRPPTWRIAPIMRPKDGEDRFEALYRASNEISEALLPEWTPDLHLVDVVKAIEAIEK